jgi:hypothetical protein
MRDVTAGGEDRVRALVARRGTFNPGEPRAIRQDDRSANPGAAEVDGDDGLGGQGETSGFDRSERG